MDKIEKHERQGGKSYLQEVLYYHTCCTEGNQAEYHIFMKYHL